MDASSEVRTYTRRKRQLGPGARRKKELDGDGVLCFTPFFPSSSCTKGQAVVRSKNGGGGVTGLCRVCRSRFGANFADLELLNLTCAC